MRLRTLRKNMGFVAGSVHGGLQTCTEQLKRMSTPRDTIGAPCSDQRTQWNL
jgi:hypothetical protein